MDRRRRFTDLERDKPHLLVVPPDQVLRAALSLYMEDSSLPLPTPEEMLICSQNTTAEEVNLSVFTLLYYEGRRGIWELLALSFFLRVHLLIKPLINVLIKFV